MVRSLCRSAKLLFQRYRRDDRQLAEEFAELLPSRDHFRHSRIRPVSETMVLRRHGRWGEGMQSRPKMAVKMKVALALFVRAHALRRPSMSSAVRVDFVPVVGRSTA